MYVVWYCCCWFICLFVCLFVFLGREIENHGVGGEIRLENNDRFSCDDG